MSVGVTRAAVVVIRGRLGMSRGTYCSDVVVSSHDAEKKGRDVAVRHDDGQRLIDAEETSLTPLDVVALQETDYPPQTNLQSFSIAPFVYQSKALKYLLSAEVDLYRVEKSVPTVGRWLVHLDSDMAGLTRTVEWLEGLFGTVNTGKILTSNILLLKEDIDDMQVRINYFISKKFSKRAIQRIVAKCPHVLSMETIDTDAKLGFYQKMFSLSGNEIRHVIESCPKLIIWPQEKIHKQAFSFVEEFGFSKDETRALLVATPKIFLRQNAAVRDKFDYVHNVMKQSHETIAKFPRLFNHALHRLTSRHQFLAEIGRDQYDPTKENFVPLDVLPACSDDTFCEKYAKVSVDLFHQYLKTV